MNADGYEFIKNKHWLKAKLVFNPKAGAARKTRIELTDVLRELKLWKIEPDVCVLAPECNLALELTKALSEGIKIFIICGGDGTVSSACNILAGTSAVIAIIPAGTQNNNAKSMNIPLELPYAVAIIRRGRLVKVDVGMAACGGIIRHFLEIVSVGLVASLTESGDDIQHGKLSGIGEFLATMVTCPPAQITLTLDGNKHIQDNGFIALVTNMPYAGFHYQFGPPCCNRDGLLNVLFFSNLSKLDLLKYISQGIYLGKSEDPRIQHYLVKKLDIDTDPPMPVTADGSVIGEGAVHIELRKKALGIMAGN